MLVVVVAERGGESTRWVIVLVGLGVREMGGRVAELARERCSSKGGTKEVETGSPPTWRRLGSEATGDEVSTLLTRLLTLTREDPGICGRISDEDEGDSRVCLDAKSLSAVRI